MRSSGGSPRTSFRGFSRGGTAGTGKRPAGRGAPAASGGLGKILGSLTGRR
jgi:hypothetical protein